MPTVSTTLCIRPVLPPAGLEGLLAMPWYPLSNAVSGQDASSHPPRFPLDHAVRAVHSRGFLSTLGDPLAIAEDLESEPGVWWLSTADGCYDFIIFSDCHRPDAWKGGQLCLSRKNQGPMDQSHPALKGLCQAFEDLWGLPPPGDFSDIPRWFDARALELGDRRWPMQEPKMIAPGPRQSRARPG